MAAVPDRLLSACLRASRAAAAGPRRDAVGHALRVAYLTDRLARALDLSPAERRWLRMGSLLHDVGKVAVPTPVLRRPGRLSAADRMLVHQHPVVGEHMVRRVGMPPPVRRIVLHHHEHWNGGGYPHGLAGEAIPLAARIVAVTDIYDALTSVRCYRPALDPADALAIMEREAGTKLDPHLFAAFQAMLGVAHRPLRRAA